MSPALKLSKHEIDSPLWQRIQAHLKAELASQRRANDKDMDAEQTAKQRGRISELKKLLALNPDWDQAERTAAD